jgi:uncharacterized membrane protein YdjX (TVP38/TMEM64 family)
VKKIKLSPRSLLKALAAASLFGLYWYYINQKLISETTPFFGLAGFFVLMSFSTAFFPLPANLLVLGAVKAHDPLVVSIVAGGGTVLAFFYEYLFFTFLFKFQKIASFKNSWLYKNAAPLFDKNKFFILAFATFLPIPSEPLRIYAITSQYSKYRYMLSGFVGRIPRYFLLGYFGKDYVNSIGFIIGVVLFPAVFLLAIRGVIALTKMVKTKIHGSPLPSQASIPIALSAEPVNKLSQPDLEKLSSDP